ncbi:MAG: hypothetical protein BGO55_08675 [Sphingobacteriales bacterium 50-39]|nr:hypothetical protein [Sphingobacteriales bacterium]OJW59336.1 MAG: hypothetical protein BGO55_08675 [Sphingobacteriales bacterium 50-39]
MNFYFNANYDYQLITMIKRKISVIAGAVILAALAASARMHAAKKFASFCTCVTAAGTARVNGSTNIFTTVSSAGSQAYLFTVQGTYKVLFTKVNRTKICYLK